jgi:5-methylcytosine-specific restriction endonuclease McrA
LTAQELILRDGPACLWCGREVWRRDLTVEHLLPRSRGGSGEGRNVVLACRRCNRSRGSRPVDAYVRDRLEAGLRPRFDLLRAALDRLAASPRREERDYGARQLKRLGGVGVSR